ncbi:MAG TPA: hypothetical protein VG125_33400, partial [Pirellulales bacterium]|nr:hypothetical protein [Pirellulales bacterium]
SFDPLFLSSSVKRLMVLENQLPPYFEWLFSAGYNPGAFWIWLLTMTGVIVFGLLVSWVLASVRYGPMKAGDLIFKALLNLSDDLVHTSPRRVFALARLAVKESIRRRVVAALIVFVVILLFAGWFLNPGKTDPAELYLSFVLTATSYLILLMALILSAFSLPADIQSRTIHTIVTKPVRTTEIILGRTLGFAAVGTGLLLGMGLLSYGFVVRTLDHTHELTDDDLQPRSAGPGGVARPGKEGLTTVTREHRHKIVLDGSGPAITESAQGHVHEVTTVTRDGRTEYRVGPAANQLKARVPVYGKLSFLDRSGRPADKGINVGNEWLYRSYIEGGTPAAAIWRFSGVYQQDFPKGVNLDMTIRVFRTYKGDVEKGILGSVSLRNPKNPKVKYLLKNFVAKEFTIDRHEIPVKFKDKGAEVDLFRDVVSDDGELDVEIACLERAQFFGVAKPDVYLFRREGTPWINFAKGYVALWLQMLLITAVGVMWSTFLNGPVSMLATVATMVGGYFREFLDELGRGIALGGGPMESLYRILTQNNLTSELEQSVTTVVLLWSDKILFRAPLFIAAHTLPDLNSLSDVNYVAKGYNIPLDVLTIHLTMALGYFVPVMILGFLFFKMREVAK